MGFLKAFGNMMKGKPAFESPADTADALSTDKTTVSPQSPASADTPKQSKIIPTFTLEHCETHINGDMIDVTVWATNTSSVDIEIDKCVIIDTKTEIDRRLSPGHAHEITLYRGPIPTTNHAHKANIFYKSIRANEYFRVDFTVEYNRESNGTFTVEELHPEHYAIKELS
jgi:hypothetical protein